MQITKATFEAPFEESEPIWALRLEVQGTEFIHRAAPIIAQVGDVMVESIVVNLSGDGFVGLIRTVPQAGAELKVGYLDSDLVATGITYEAPNV